MMRRLGKFLILLMATVMLFSFTLQSASAKIDIKVAFWDQGENARAQYKALCDAFNASQNEINAIPDPIPGNILATIMARVAGGTAPDLIWYHNDWLPAYADQNMVLDLTPFIKKDNYDLDDFFPNAIAGVTYNGKIYALPLGANPVVLGYNMDMFDAAGAEYPNKKWSWNDFLAVARKLTIRDGSGKAKQFGFTGFFGFFADYEGWLPLLWSNGGDLYDRVTYPTVSTVTSPEVIDSLTFVKDIRFKYRVERLPDEQGSDLGGDERFIAGQSAMAFVTQGIRDALRKANSRFNWNIEIYPRGSKGQSGAAALSCFSVMAASKNPEAAWEFLKFQASREGSQAIQKVTKQTVSFSTRKSEMKEIIENYPDKSINIMAFVETLAVGRTCRYRSKPGADTEPIITEALRKVFSGQMDALPAMRQVKPVLDATLRKANR